MRDQMDAILVVEKGIHDVSIIPLSKPVSLLGTSSTADIVLDNPYVSRLHANIMEEDGRFRIRDLGSTNGTFVNSTRLQGEDHWLNSGDRIELAEGQVVLRFQENSATRTMILDLQSEQSDLRSYAAPDGTTTILFSDMEGSTAMTERLGDQRAQEVLHIHNAIIRQQVITHGGFEVKTQGDGFMLAFSSARWALQCAIAIQRAFAANTDQHSGEPILVRIGLHTGEAIKEGYDFFGKSVILAARVAGQAEGGQILVSSLLKELVESIGEFEFGESRQVELKGLSGQHLVYEVRWE